MASVLEKGLLIALSSLSAIVAITILLPFVGPFLLALLLAALIDQPVNWLESAYVLEVGDIPNPRCPGLSAGLSCQ